MPVFYEGDTLQAVSEITDKDGNATSVDSFSATVERDGTSVTATTTEESLGTYVVQWDASQPGHYKVVTTAVKGGITDVERDTVLVIAT